MLPGISENLSWGLKDQDIIKRLLPFLLVDMCTVGAKAMVAKTARALA